MKKIIIITTIVIVTILSLILMFNINKTKQLELAEKEAQMMLLEKYSRSLHITGDFAIVDGKITITNKTFDEEGLIKDVALYNAFFKEETITIDKLLEEYKLFCVNMAESALLESYRNRMQDIENQAQKINRHSYGYDYERYIIEYLNDNYGKGISDATTEELKEASIYGAEQFYNEVVNAED